MSRTPPQQSRRYSLQELAQLTGMTVRNVRAYQTRGLIPPPMREGRRSVYTEAHLQRLKAIKAARDEGATLNLINSHLSRGGDLSEESVHLQLSTLRDSTTSEGNDRSTVLDARFNNLSSPEALARIERLVSQGVLRRNGGRLVADRTLAKGANAAVRQSVPAENTLEVIEVAVSSGQRISASIEKALLNVQPDSRTTSGNSTSKSRMYLLDLAAVAINQVTVIDVTALERQAESEPLPVIPAE